MSLHKVICPLCEATCGLEIELRDGVIEKIGGNKEDSFSQGYLCPKAVALKDLHEDPDRLRTPVRRTSSGWEQISWDQAYAEIGEKLTAIRKQYGRNAIGTYFGNPTVHSFGAMTFGQLFFRAVRTKNKFSATSTDQLPHMLASLLMFGHQLMIPVPDIDRTDYMLILGANPMVSNGSIMTAPNFPTRMASIQEKGGKVIVVDPRRTRTAQKSDQHVQIRPGTDAFFLLGVLQILFQIGAQPKRLAEHIEGLEELRSITQSFSLEDIENITKIPVATIAELANGFANADRAVCYGRLGVCAQEFGGLSAWLVNCVNIVSGNFDKQGGAMFPKPAVDLRAVTARLGNVGSFDRYRSRVRNLPEFGGEFPVSTMADEIEKEGDGQIRALITHAGNPVLSIPNGKRLEKSLANLDYMVSIDIYCNETTRHANIILPPTTGLERDHYDLIFSLFSVRDFARWSPAIFSRTETQRHDWEIFAELSKRLQPKGKGVKGKAYGAILRLTTAAGPRRLLDFLLRFGPETLSLRKLAKQPNGIDLGALKPCLPEGLFHKSKKIVLCPKPFTDDLQRLQKRLGRPSKGLLLIGRRDIRSNNSWMHNSVRLTKGKERCTLQINPADAQPLSLVTGDQVRISSKTGNLTAQVVVTDDLMPGVVSLPHGWGHHRNGTGQANAAKKPGISLNDISDETFLDLMSGNAGLNGIEVELHKVAP